MRNYAMLGHWHVHAPQYAGEVNALEGCRIAKVWDPDEAAARAWAQELGAQAASLDGILSDETIEGVLVCCATNEHDDIIVRACDSGKAVFTEKVLSLTNEGAEAIRQAVLRNHTRFAISLPHLCDPAIRCALETAKSGRLGSVNFARMRKAHNGASAGWLPDHFFDVEACGGGAMIDLGAHPMYLLCEIFGEPERVQSAFTSVTGRGVEDNAVSLLTFPGGRIGVSETGFVSTGYPLVLEIGGDKGTVLARNDEVWLSSPDRRGALEKVETLPERLAPPVQQWALANAPEDIPESIGIDAAVRLTRVMVAAYANA